MIMWLSMGMEAHRPIWLLPTGLRASLSSLHSFKAGVGSALQSITITVPLPALPSLNTFQKCLYGCTEYTMGIFSVSLIHTENHTTSRILIL